MALARLDRSARTTGESRSALAPSGSCSLNNEVPQGAVRDQHLDAYLDEFVFRFNRRHSRNRGLIFWRLICSLMESRVSVTNQQLRQRLSEQVIIDETHATRVKTRRNANKAEKRREIRRIEAQDQGRSVRPYHRRTQGDDDIST